MYSYSIGYEGFTTHSAFHYIADWCYIAKCVFDAIKHSELVVKKFISGVYFLYVEYR